MNKILLTCAVLATLSLFAATYLLGRVTADTSTVVTRIQSERLRNTRLTCNRDNLEHAAIVGFIEKSIPKSKKKDPLVIAYLARAHRTWPQWDCDVVADRLVHR